jgi:hypothetical protein
MGANPHMNKGVSQEFPPKRRGAHAPSPASVYVVKHIYEVYKNHICHASTALHNGHCGISSATSSLMGIVGSVMQVLPCTLGGLRGGHTYPTRTRRSLGTPSLLAVHAEGRKGMFHRRGTVSNVMKW